MIKFFPAIHSRVCLYGCQRRIRVTTRLPTTLLVIPGASLLETFKFGGDFDLYLYNFETLEDIEDFYMGCYRYIKQCLGECWSYKAEALALFPVADISLPEL